jgi:hypothetical protein
MYVELDISSRPAGSEAFWKKALQMNIRSIKTDVCVTSDAVTGAKVLWQGRPGEYLGVKVAPLDKLGQWGQSIHQRLLTVSLME